MVTFCVPVPPKLFLWLLVRLCQLFFFFICKSLDLRRCSSEQLFNLGYIFTFKLRKFKYGIGIKTLVKSLDVSSTLSFLSHIYSISPSTYLHLRNIPPPLLPDHCYPCQQPGPFSPGLSPCSLTEENPSSISLDPFRIQLRISFFEPHPSTTSPSPICNIPVESFVEFKIPLLTFKATHKLAPQYLSHTSSTLPHPLKPWDRPPPFTWLFPLSISPPLPSLGVTTFAFHFF